ncbi:MAG: hypothetical protein ACLFUJ_02885 [Phycisphaerae bacterium]
MHPKLQSILRKAHRKSIGRHTIEMTCLGGTAALLGLLPVLLADMAFGPSWLAALPASVPGLLVAVLLVKWARLPRILHLSKDQGLVSAWAMVLSLVVAIYILAPFRQETTALIVVVLPAGTFGLWVSAIAAWHFRPSLSAVACRLDRRLGLEHRLATVVMKPEPVDPEALSAVEKQVVSALEHRPVESGDLPSINPVPLGLLAMTILASAILVTFDHRNIQATPFSRVVARQVERLSADQRNRFADSLYDAAGRTDSSEQARLLADAARAARKADRQELTEALARLEAMGIEPTRYLPPDVQAAAGISTDQEPGLIEAPQQQDQQGPTKLPPPPAGPVLVWQPDVQPQGDSELQDPGIASQWLPISDAWALARARAADAIAAGQVRPEHRAIVLEYFRRQDAFESDLP